MQEMNHKKENLHGFCARHKYSININEIAVFLAGDTLAL